MINLTKSTKIKNEYIEFDHKNKKVTLYAELNPFGSYEILDDGALNVVLTFDQISAIYKNTIIAPPIKNIKFAYETNNLTQE